MRHVLVIGLALGLVGVVADDNSSASTRSDATAYALSARMTPQQVVTPTHKPWKVPATVADARGSFVGNLRVVGGTRKLEWRITYSGIGRPPLVIADIHLGKPGRFGQIIVRLCAPCRSGQRGTTKVTAMAAKAIATRNAWATVITSTYPNGVIRGQIQAR